MNFEKLSQRYRGKIAGTYDFERTSGKKWEREDEAVLNLLRGLPKGCSLVDIPVGTGRFIKFYRDLELNPVGMDISEDMLKNSRIKADESMVKIPLLISDIRKIESENSAFDCSLCVRFLNWIDLPGFTHAISELSRVSRKHLIIGVRHFVPLREFKPIILPKNLFRLLSQLSRRVVGRGGLVFHEKQDIIDVFLKENLEIKRSECIEERDDGTDYYIYHLIKKT